MEVHARSAAQARINLGGGQLIAHIVHQTLSLQLAVSQIPPASVMLVIQDKMEAHVRRARPAALIKLGWDLPGALIVDKADMRIKNWW